MHKWKNLLALKFRSICAGKILCFRLHRSEKKLKFSWIREVIQQTKCNKFSIKFRKLFMENWATWVELYQTTAEVSHTWKKKSALKNVITKLLLLFSCHWNFFHRVYVYDFDEKEKMCEKLSQAREISWKTRLITRNWHCACSKTSPHFNSIDHMRHSVDHGLATSPNSLTKTCEYEDETQKN